MSGRLRIRDARPSDEPDLRALSEVELPGPIRMAFRQTPDFFAAERVRGETRLGVLTDDSDAVLGCGARVVRRTWFNGAWCRTGYYCTLRATPAGRNARAVVTAYSWARDLERADPLPVLTSTILSGNMRARRLLTSRRFSLPAYLDAGEVMTFTVTVRALRRVCSGGEPVEVLTGEEIGEPALRAFFADERGLQPLFPELPEPLPPALALGDFVVLRIREEVVAAAALWDQRPLRQVRITGYAPWLCVVRPLVNLVFGLRALPRLPKPGSDLPFRYLAFRRQRDADPRLFRALMSAVSRRLAAHELVSFSLHRDDPLFAEAMRLRAFRSASRLYTLSYDADPRPVDFGGAPYIEAGML